MADAARRASAVVPRGDNDPSSLPPAYPVVAPATPAATGGNPFAGNVSPDVDDAQFSSGGGGGSRASAPASVAREWGGGGGGGGATYALPPAEPQWRRSYGAQGYGQQPAQGGVTSYGTMAANGGGRSAPPSSVVGWEAAFPAADAPAGAGRRSAPAGYQYSDSTTAVVSDQRRSSGPGLAPYDVTQSYMNGEPQQPPPPSGGRGGRRGRGNDGGGGGSAPGSSEVVFIDPAQATLTPAPIGVKPDTDGPKRRPWVGYFIFAGCLAGFGYSLYITPGVIAPLAQNPLIGPTADSLVASGAKVTCLINGPRQEWWRLVSPLWLHAGVIHLVANMHMLSQLGFDLERQAGHARFALIYFTGGVFSMVVSALFTPQSVTVGASGALFGLLGAYLAELITNCHLLSRKDACCAFASLMLSILINLAIGLLPFVDNFAHIGGLLGGMLLGFVLLLHTDRTGALRCKQVAGAVMAAIAYCLLFTAGVMLLWFHIDMLKYCHDCQYMSCVPSPWWTCEADESAVSVYCAADGGGGTNGTSSRLLADLAGGGYGVTPAFTRLY